MAKIEKIGNIQIVDNKEDKFFYFPMILWLVPGLGVVPQNGRPCQDGTTVPAERKLERTADSA